MNHEYCESCGQKISYEITLDKGTAKMMVAIAKFVREKGYNVFSNTKEMIADGKYDFNAAGNITRPKFHGLIAKIPGKVTNYCITDKGFRFLNGEPIESTVIILKKNKENPVKVVHTGGKTVTINDLLSDWKEYWSASGYEIKAGFVVNKPKV